MIREMARANTPSILCYAWTQKTFKCCCFASDSLILCWESSQKTLVHVIHLRLLTRHVFIANSSISNSEYLELVRGARDALSGILSSPRQSYPFKAACYVVRFQVRHRKLQQCFITHDGVIGKLVVTLERTAKSATGDMFLLVMDSLCYLIHDGASDQNNLVYTLTF